MKFINNTIKRLFDIVMSLCGLIICIPLFIVVTIAVKIDSPGAVIFKQARVGKNGKLFNIYKFRSMVVNSENSGDGLFNYENDPRVTKVGNFIRNTSLDEIPQFINIFVGDMAFVGPRPPVSYELGDYSDYSGDLKKSFSVRPGVTGLAQVSGRNELNWEQKTKFNLLYLEKYNKYGILFDFYILILTVAKVIRNEGSHELSVNSENDKGLQQDNNKGQ